MAQNETWISWDTGCSRAKLCPSLRLVEVPALSPGIMRHLGTASTAKECPTHSIWSHFLLGKRTEEKEEMRPLPALRVWGLGSKWRTSGKPLPKGEEGVGQRPLCSLLPSSVPSSFSSTTPDFPPHLLSFLPQLPLPSSLTPLSPQSHTPRTLLQKDPT